MIINFLKKQCAKLLIYFFILGVITILFFYCNWNKNTLLSIISLITSIFIAFMGKTWIDDYKLEIDKELENYKKELNKEVESYKAKLSGYTLVTKLQYELEFSIYKEIYYDLIQIYKIYNELKIVPEKIEEFKLLLNNFIIKSTQNSPFYSQEIYYEVSKITFLIQSLSANMSNQNNISQFLSVNEFITMNFISNLSKLIRKRIENMKIIEN